VSEEIKTEPNWPLIVFMWIAVAFISGFAIGHRIGRYTEESPKVEKAEPNGKTVSFKL
jgi:hypothetical protein